MAVRTAKDARFRNKDKTIMFENIAKDTQFNTSDKDMVEMRRN